MLTLDIRALDDVADQQRAHPIWGDAQLQPAVQGQLVRLRLWLVRLNGPDGQKGHLTIPCPTGVRKILSSNAIDRDRLEPQKSRNLLIRNGF